MKTYKVKDADGKIYKITAENARQATKLLKIALQDRSFAGRKLKTGQTVHLDPKYVKEADIDEEEKEDEYEVVNFWEAGKPVKEDTSWESSSGDFAGVTIKSKKTGKKYTVNRFQLMDEKHVFNPKDPKNKDRMIKKIWDIVGKLRMPAHVAAARGSDDHAWAIVYSERHMKKLMEAMKAAGLPTVRGSEDPRKPGTYIVSATDYHHNDSVRVTKPVRNEPGDSVSERVSELLSDYRIYPDNIEEGSYREAYIDFEEKEDRDKAIKILKSKFRQVEPSDMEGMFSIKVKDSKSFDYKGITVTDSGSGWEFELDGKSYEASTDKEAMEMIDILLNTKVTDAERAYEVLWYEDEKARGDYKTKDFNSLQGAMHFYARHKNDTDKFHFMVTSRDPDSWEIIKTYVY